MPQLLFNQGLNTSADRSSLAPGELQVATGAYYRPGDTLRLWKILGRTSYGDAYAGAYVAQGLALFAFDTAGTDRLVVYNSNGEYHSSVVSASDSTSGTFSTLTTGFTTGSTSLAWAHFNDRWYFCNSKDRPLVLESDGSVRQMGMLDPDKNLVAVATSGNYTGRVTTATYTGSEWNDLTVAYDGDLDTFAYTWIRETDGLNDAHTAVWSAAAADTSSNRVVIINWSLQGMPKLGTEPTVPDSSQEFKVQTIFHVSEDAGSTWTTIFNGTAQNSKPAQNLQVGVTADSDQIQVKATLKQLLSNPTKAASMQIRDIRITNEGFIAVFTTSDGIYYGLSEYSEDDDLESPLVGSNLVELASQNIVQLTLPTKVNAHATHFKIYRTHDGGLLPGDLRVKDIVPIAETTWVDTFDTPKDYVGGDVAPLLKLQATDNIFVYYASNTAPEAFRAIVEYQNFLVGISEQFPRQLSYSLPGEPEYWPLLYNIVDFPLKEHDQLQALGVAGDLLIVAAREALIVINGLPELEVQSYANADMTVLRGAPGCVGPYAMTEYSLAGEPRVVYISEQGVYETNGHTVNELSGDIDWGASVSRGKLSKSWIFWDKEEQILQIGVDTDGDSTPDREYWFHMAPEHRKQGGGPKISGPHYSSKTNQVGGLAADGRWRVYSVDNDTSGAVYHEKDGGTDAGNFYSTVSQIPFDVKTARIYGPDLEEWSVDFPTVRHTTWNNTAVKFSWAAGRDEIGETDTAITTLTLSTQGQTRFVVARSGEWHELRVESYANASTAASLVLISHNGQLMGMQGDTQKT